MERPLFVLGLIATMLLGTKGFRVQLVVPRIFQFPTDLRGPLTPLVKGAIMANISIGEPPVPQLLVMDTGSHVTWIRSIPCASVTPMCNYDPTKSSTFTPLYDNQGKREVYDITYGDGLRSQGTLGLEKLTFRTFEDGLEEIRDATIGCAATIVDDNMPEAHGLLGLRSGTDSVFSRWKNFSKFSYCIGNLLDPNNMDNILILGDGAIIQGDTVKLMSRNYQVELNGISIGEKVIDIGDFYREITIDSGTTLTLLTRDLLDALKKEVSALMTYSEIVPIRGLELCYRGNMNNDLKGFPTIHLTLGGVFGAIELGVEGLFSQLNDSTFCLAFQEHSTNVLGIIAQQYYNVGFNLGDLTVTFERIDCKLLEG